MKEPNFFIIGAPKCGTTSLATWLAEHPRIYMSPIKEPHWYSTDLNLAMVHSEDGYKHLFNDASDYHIAVGEASAFYLFSKYAVPQIEKEHAGAKYIVLIRNPVEMAYSLHDEAVYKGWEHIHYFEKAWELSPERRKGRLVRPWCREPRFLDYQSICRLGEQVERLYKIVPRQRVLIITLDEMKQNPRSVYVQTLDFLGVPDDGRTDFPVLNPAKELRFPWLKKMLLGAGILSRFAKSALGIPGHRGTGLLNAADKLITSYNRRFRPRPPLDKKLRERLTNYFHEDIELLSKLTNIDLSHWIEGERQ